LPTFQQLKKTPHLKPRSLTLTNEQTENDKGDKRGYDTHSGGRGALLGSAVTWLRGRPGHRDGVARRLGVSGDDALPLPGDADSATQRVCERSQNALFFIPATHLDDPDPPTDIPDNDQTPSSAAVNECKYVKGKRCICTIYKDNAVAVITQQPPNPLAQYVHATASRSPETHGTDETRSNTQAGGAGGAFNMVKQITTIKRTTHDIHFNRHKHTRCVHSHW